MARTIDEDGAGTTYSPATEYFVYDGDGATNWALADASTSEDGTIPFGADPATDAGQIVLQLDDAGDPTHRYLWGPAVDLLLADEQLSPLPPGEGQGEGGVVRWMLGDHQNSVRDILILDDAGTPANPADDQWLVGNHVAYDAFGNVVDETNAAVDCIFGFTGRLFDQATGLQNNTNRWYDPSVGRWISEDPIGFDAHDANLYRYCDNDPINWVDSSGLVNRKGYRRIGTLVWISEDGHLIIDGPAPTTPSCNKPPCKSKIVEPQVCGPVKNSCNLTGDAKKLLEEYQELQRKGFTGNNLIRGMIIHALFLTNGDATAALGIVMDIRDNTGGGNDDWACVDHYLNSLAAKQRSGLWGAIGSTVWNVIYTGAKASGIEVPRDKQNVRPSPATWRQLFWGNQGAWEELWAELLGWKK